MQSIVVVLRSKFYLGKSWQRALFGLQSHHHPGKECVVRERELVFVNPPPRHEESCPPGGQCRTQLKFLWGWQKPTFHGFRTLPSISSRQITISRLTYMADKGFEAGGEGLFFSEDLIQSPTHQIAETSTVDFDGLLHPVLLLRQDLSQGNGGQAWPCGLILAKYLLRKKRDDLRNCSMSVRRISYLT